MTAIDWQKRARELEEMLNEASRGMTRENDKLRKLVRESIKALTALKDWKTVDYLRDKLDGT